MKRTISAMIGKGSVTHNSRSFSAENVDSERTHLNIDYCNEPIKKVYHELFDEALKQYNDKQKRKDRKIPDYYEKIRTGKQEKLFHEVIFQIGNKEDMSATGEYAELASVILDEYYRGFQERNSYLRVFSAHLHLDEATPHIHIDFIPFTTGSKRGLETRVSLKQAMLNMGFKGEGKSDNELNRWILSEKKVLAEIMKQHGIEWEQQRGTHEKHLSVLNYKKKERAKEVAELEVEIKEYEEMLEAQDYIYKNKSKKLAHKGEIIAQQESLLEESRKSFRKEVEEFYNNRELTLNHLHKLIDEARVEKERYDKAKKILLEYFYDEKKKNERLKKADMLLENINFVSDISDELLNSL
jgi:hypothetical protein